MTVERRGIRKKTRSVFVTIMLPLLILVALEAAFFFSAIYLSGVIHKLNQNSQDLVSKQVENRRNYLESEMVGSWSDLSLLAGSINEEAQRLIQSGEITLEDLDKSSDKCAPLLLSVTDDLISTMYAKRLSGVFIVFNTADLSGENPAREAVYRPGIYIRDLDATSAPSYRNADLLLERAPIEVVRALNISTDSSWYPRYEFTGRDDDGYFDILFQPFQAAYAEEGIGDPNDYGYWNPRPFALEGSGIDTLTYSIPLALPDGTLYGVLGVELLADYLRSMMPFEEVFSDRQGAYLLAVENEAGGFTPILETGPIALGEGGGPISIAIAENNAASFQLGDEEFFANVQYLRLYNSNTPFEEQRWALIGAVRQRELTAFSRSVTGIMSMVVVAIFLGGLLGCVFISYRLARPIRSLAEDVDRAQHQNEGIPQLPATGIREIDRFSQAITSLSRQVVDSSTRFLRIMDMASVDLAGFEIRLAEKSLFVTENYFPLFGVEDVEVAGLSAEEFIERTKRMDAAFSSMINEDGSKIYRVPLVAGGVRYVRMEVTRDEEVCIGLAEDVTSATLERLRIEHERDYDLLTGLYNRRAFYRIVSELFEQPEKLRHAALMMLDLDNLKRINDHFGHDLGDQYIRSAGQCFLKSVPEATLCARVSGDEFFLFFHGYEEREGIREAIAGLTEAIHNSVFVVPSGERMRICASGGIAWYPEDSMDYGELMKYADFAMYQSKQSHKGALGDFDLGVYDQENFLIQNRREFRNLLEEERISYHFQPIVDGKTGKIRAYEALMRVDLPTIKNPEAVLQLAREEGRLDDIERLTWFKAGESFQSLSARGALTPDAYLFINSIANHCMSDEDCREFSRRFGSLKSRIVAEITESEDLDIGMTRAKRNMPGFSGLFALDDYGSGYNSEKNLLALSPQFIKVDISIIRGIDKDVDKQKIVANIVGYAHERGIAIVAEGLENAAEVGKVLELGVDLLQGFYLARPSAVPGDVSQIALQYILSEREKTGEE